MNIKPVATIKDIGHLLHERVRCRRTVGGPADFILTQGHALDHPAVCQRFRDEKGAADQ